MTEGYSHSKSTKEQLAEVRDQLRHWPYTIHQIDDTLDIGLIEGRGKQLLFRAIHARNLTAFAGTGLSMGYGRLGWKEWEAEQKRIADANSESFLKLSAAAIELIEKLILYVLPMAEWDGSVPKFGNQQELDLWHHLDPEKKSTEAKHETGWGQKEAHNVWRWLRTRSSALLYAKFQIERLKQTFDLAGSDDGTFPGGEELPVKFEVAQQLHHELYRHISLFLPDLPQGGAVTESWEEWLKDARLGARADQKSSAPVDSLGEFEKILDNYNDIEPLKTLRKEYYNCFNDFAERMARPEAALKFETLAKALLVDECPHALLLLRNGVFRGKDPESKKSKKIRREWTKFTKNLDIFKLDNLKRDLDGIRENQERYRVLTPFKISVAKRLIKMHRINGDLPEWQDMDSVVYEKLNAFVTSERTVDPGGERIFLSPSSRFLVSVYICRLTSLKEWKKNEIESSIEAGDQPSYDRLFDRDGVLSPPEITDFKNRKSIIAPMLDPLRRAVGDLGIRRYVTTNYDFEIERFFQDSGYRTFADEPEPDGLSETTGSVKHDPDAFRTDSIGGVLRDQTFSEKTAADMIGFAIEAGEHDAAVYHLHGRATHEDNLVITERDYMELYMTEGPGRETADEGISLVFSGAPLVFLGLGMSETDLLRPLRQFISNRDRTIGYTSIALLPADSSIEARTKFSSALFLRYGVYTIFYGSGAVQLRSLTEEAEQVESPAEVTGTEENRQDPKEYGLDWMNRVLSLINAMRKVTQAFIDYDDEEIEECPELVERVEKERSAIQDDPETPADETSANLAGAVEIFKALEKAVKPIGPDLADTGYSKDTPALRVLLGLKTPLMEAGQNEKTGNSDKEKEKQKKASEAQVRDICKRILSESSKSRSLKLVNCTFVPVRPRNAPSRHRDVDPPVNSADFLSFELDLLTEMLAMTLRLRSNLSDDEFKRGLPARILMLDGLAGGVRTSCMNAALESIVQEQRQWWKRFQQSPPHRVARFQDVPPVEPGEPRRYVRHSVDSVITDMSRLEKDKLPPGALRTKQDPGALKPQVRTEIRAFDTFIAALDGRSEPDGFAPDQRALLTVAAHRGIGKGTFMAAMASRRGLDLYTRAVWGRHQGVSLSGAIFVNLSFSPEIGSVLDMLVEAVRSEAIQLSQRGGVEPETLEKNLKAVRKAERQVSRMTRLRAALAAYGEASDKVAQSNWFARIRPRLMISISSAELLFDVQRRTKSTEIEMLLDILTGPDHQNLPIDVVFVGAEKGLGPPWSVRKDKSEKNNAPHRRLLNRPSLPQRAEETVKRRLRNSMIIEDDALSPNGTERARHFIHFARPVNPTTFLIDNFPTLATALFLANPPTAQEDKDSEHTKLLEDARQAFEACTNNALTVSDETLGVLWKRRELPHKGELAVARDIVRRCVLDEDKELLDKSRDRKKRSATDEIQTAINRISSLPSELDRTKSDREVLTDRICRAADISVFDEDSEAAPENTDREKTRLLAALRKRLRHDPHRQEWRVVRQRLGDSRFSLTILIAAAEHMVIHAEKPIDAGKRASNFILTTVEQSRNFGIRKRDEHVLEAVLGCYRGYHQIGDPDLDCDLHLLLIRHLGVIASPVGSAVLVRLPDIREYFNRIGVELENSRRRFIVRALTTLAYRGLVFRLDPHPRLVALEKEQPSTEQKSWPADLEFRYALHRIVQRFAISKLNVGADDPVKVNSFAPTLYAAMPSTGPRLSSESYKFLRSLLLGLSQYPDISNRESGITPWLFTTKDRSVRVQALRASLSLVRSNLSVAIVSRLSDTLSKPVGLQKRGYLETYKVRLRWIVRLAWELLDEEYQSVETQPDQEFRHINALYRDEIVWLYNELGVVSLAQGALSDGLGFLRQAAEFNQHIEGRTPGGPNYNHISLNHGIVQLERGRLSSARQRLEKVKEAARPRKCAMFRLAEGYLCVLDHITGLHEGLDNRFAEVTQSLQQLPATRASAIMLQHRARFLAKTQPELARENIDRATVLAETGGHEDVRHHCNLVSIRINSIATKEGGLIPQDRTFGMLHDIESYASRMSIWSLQCECLMYRASLLVAESETTTAGRLLMRAIAIAKRHSMGLRLNRATTLYALMLFVRGDRRGAARIANVSLEMAKSFGYNLETTRAQIILSDCRGDRAFSSATGEYSLVQF